MVSENARIVQDYLAALERGDRDAARKWVAVDVVLDMSGSDIPERGVYRGLQGIEKFSASWREAWETYSVEVKHVIEVSDAEVLTLVEEHAKSRSGVEVHGQRTADLYTLRDGLIVRIYEYPTWEAAASARGIALATLEP